MSLRKVVRIYPGIGAPLRACHEPPEAYWLAGHARLPMHGGFAYSTRVSAYPSPIVRRAGPADLAALVALEDATFAHDRLSRAQYRRHLDSPSALVLVARHGRRLAGSAVVFFRRGTRVARLYSLATATDARGQGVGAGLLRAAGQAATRRGCRCVRLEVRADNAAAMALYERAGYARIGRLAGYYADGADAWRYEKPLPGKPRGV